MATHALKEYIKGPRIITLSVLNPDLLGLSQQATGFITNWAEALGVTVFGEMTFEEVN